MQQTLVNTESKPAGREILDIDVAWLGWSQAFDGIRQALSSDQQTILAFLNAHNANMAMTNQQYHAALERCTVLPDGFGVDLAARALYGTPFPANLNGTDFVPALLTYLVKPRRVALIGAQHKVLSKATSMFQQQTPWHEFVAVSDGYFEKNNCGTVLEKLAALKPDIVLVAMGSPLQELWIEHNIGKEHGKVVISVGALFDFVSESVPRAPSFIRKLRSEWVFRLFWEPRRLWRRYILGNPLFLLRVLRYKYSRARPAAA
ncbi:MAG: WecB/TagA/CpsF family glycosyltransferase [Hyphomicrobiales bacterium]|nr:WecB/TagA/CpsF family glycosyltransferase [Hyphomicrobiales bacterium]MCP5000759.1 WecB/TagA/CpsF family glycosyltransferase [Hyphomicrobiales bacterium]